MDTIIEGNGLPSLNFYLSFIIRIPARSVSANQSQRADGDFAYRTFLFSTSLGSQ